MGIDIQRKWQQRRKSGYIQGAAKTKRRKIHPRSWDRSWLKWRERRGAEDN